MAITHSDGKITHSGLVLGRGHDWYNNSMDVTSFHAMVWNPETGKPEDICYGSDWSSDERGSFTVDASPDVVVAYEAYRAAQEEAQRKADEEREYNAIRVGKTVEVVRGRKVPHGTKGQVFWMGDKGYGMSVGIRDASGNVHWTAESNVQVIQLAENELTAIQAQADASKATWKANNPRPTYNSAHTAMRRNGQRYGRSVYR